jgi:hypothetical protein
LASNSYKSAMGLRQHIAPMRFQPFTIPAKLFDAVAVPSNLGRIRHLFDNELGFVHGLLLPQAMVFHDRTTLPHIAT